MKGSPPDLKRKKSFAPYSGFTPDDLVFTHYYSCPADVHPRGKVFIKWQYYTKLAKIDIQKLHGPLLIHPLTQNVEAFLLLVFFLQLKTFTLRPISKIVWDQSWKMSQWLAKGSLLPGRSKVQTLTNKGLLIWIVTWYIYWMLCISTSFWVLRAPKSWLKHFFQPLFNLFCNYLYIHPYINHPSRVEIHQALLSHFSLLA